MSTTLMKYILIGSGILFSGIIIAYIILSKKMQKSEYTPIAKPIVEKVKTLILIGKTATKIYDAVKKELENQNKQLDIYMCESLQQSLELAKRLAEPGQVVLFSPASTSFDMFNNMYERGDIFRDEVNEL